MSRIPRSAVGNMIYHVLNRANGREQIFKKQKDYKAFENILLEAKEKCPMRIISFCLMPNHWHLVLHPQKGEDMPKFMRWITHTHTQRYHAHYKSIGYGHVYQGRYKSFPIEKDVHFLQACRYVERNPLRAGLVQKVEDWQWSSLWIREKGNEKQKKLLSGWPTKIPDNYLLWINQLQENEEEKLKKIRHSITKSCPFGKDNWVKQTAKKLRLLSTLKRRGRPKKGT